jgi:uncharacterized damage-inducible protein DinB
MKLTEFFREELDREVERSRKALQEVPTGKHDWKPHERSMIFGYLANLVATIPMWIQLEIERDELDVAPPEGKGMRPEPKETSEELFKELDEAAAGARAALEKTTDEHLRTNWKLLAGGHVVAEETRYMMIQETFNHWAHHRGQMTVYLRLMGQKVPALFGPSADDQSF